MARSAAWADAREGYVHRLAGDGDLANLERANGTGAAWPTRATGAGGRDADDLAAGIVDRHALVDGGARDRIELVTAGEDGSNVTSLPPLSIAVHWEADGHAIATPVSQASTLTGVDALGEEGLNVTSAPC